MTDVTLKRYAELIDRARSEIENLQKKLAAKEPEGWEGSARRIRLKAELAEASEAIKKTGVTA